MLFSRLTLVALLSVLAVAPVSAQPNLPRALQPRVPEAAPIINPEAKSAVDAMLAKYAALKSYSDKTQVTLEGADKFPADMRDSFPLNATLSWQRPAELRFEGTMGTKKFLALSGDETYRAINPRHPNLWIERAQHPPLVVTNPDGTTTTYPTTDRAVRLDAPVLESGATSFGLAFMTDKDFWPRTLKDVTVMALAPDAEVDGQKCRVINVQAKSDQGNSSFIRLWIAREDDMLRRLELGFDGMGPNAKLVETHTQLQANPKIPDSTWIFQPPVGAKPVESFPNPDPHNLDPALKIGDTLPTFSADDLKGQPFELNAKSGKVTVLHFFLMGMGSYNLQTLQKLQNTVGPDKLQIALVSGDALQNRLEKFTEKYKLTLPIYFDEGAMRNQLAQKFGVVGWPQTFIFDKDGKLKTITGMPGTVDFHEGIKKLLPDTLEDAFILQDNELINPD